LDPGVSFAFQEDAFLMSEQEAGKAMLVVAKRAPDAQIVEHIKPQGEYDDREIR
jgi:hypothetical protein